MTFLPDNSNQLRFRWVLVEYRGGGRNIFTLIKTKSIRYYSVFLEYFPKVSLPWESNPPTSAYRKTTVHVTNAYSWATRRYGSGTEPGNLLF